MCNELVFNTLNAVVYTNWKGRKGNRLIIPHRVWYGTTEYHTEPQMLLDAFDMEKKEERTFALKDMEIPKCT